jgi:hypothetical protein
VCPELCPPSLDMALRTLPTTTSVASCQPNSYAQGLALLYQQERLDGRARTHCETWLAS